MTLTDEEAREIVNALGFKAPCFLCYGLGRFDDSSGNQRYCVQCGGWGYLSKNQRLITLLESRIGTEDDLTTAYMAGFEKGKESALARIRELEGALRPFLATGVDWPPYVKSICVTREEYDRAARALKGEG